VRPFVKRFAPCYQTVVCMYVLSVCDVPALWPNGWTDQDETWHAGRPRSWPYYVRWEPSTLPRKGTEPPPQFSAHFYCGQTAGWIKMPLGMKVGLSPGDSVLDGDPVPSPQSGWSPSPIFGAFLLWPNGWMHQDASAQGTLCEMGTQPLPKKEAEPPIFGPCLLWPNGWMDQDGTWHGGRP